MNEVEKNGIKCTVLVSMFVLKGTGIVIHIVRFLNDTLRLMLISSVELYVIGLITVI